MKLIIASIFCFVISNCAGAGLDKLRIIGGRSAYIGQFPHQVSLRDRYNQHFCGGSILNPTTILTAAHCVCKNQQVCTSIVVGTNKVLPWQQTKNNYIVKHVECYPKYDNRTYVNDLAIIKLKSAMPFSEYIQPIKLPTRNIGENKNLILSGWGWVKIVKLDNKIISHQGTDDLQYIELRTLSMVACVELLVNNGITDYLSKGHLCTIANRFTGGACNGDSGGPLIGEDGVQYGIISWGLGCSGRPDVFTNVYNYKGWIEAMMLY